ncbi:MAG: thioredoxin family protein [Allomuricauda sp.]|jgi:thioredoxin-like negative regulator of GroEL|uniref:thioredoxin family protein n=1 Tax=Allomuricauda sp. ARW1Y1 TaxID=2663843 RepID=UPI0015CC9A16|nr:thioredoxin family protein [Muricauda sp. ARW1Y1]NYJ26856.1 thioredoxin-like negative regulator of GroEL [Muricauda sp. ARW1Y1]
MTELIFFTSKTCGVCKVLKPKLLDAVQANFPKVGIRLVDVEEEEEFTGQSMVFTLPVVIIKVDGREMYRFARSFSVYEVLEKLKRLSAVSS